MIFCKDSRVKKLFFTKKRYFQALITLSIISITSIITTNLDFFEPSLDPIGAKPLQDDVKITVFRFFA